MPQKQLKVIYMGTPDFALLPLQALLDDEDFKIEAVVTQPDQKVGRKQLLTPSPVKILALQAEVPVLQPESTRKNPEFITLLKNLKPDFIVVVAYGQILPKAILAIPRFGCINLHGSLLPKYRGASPVEEALLQGDQETGITFMRLAEGLDSGDIWLIQRLTIDPQDNALSLRLKLSQSGAIALPFLLKDIAEGILYPLPQNHAKATYCHKIKKEDGLIDPKTMTAQEIHNRMRAYVLWPSVFLMVHGKRLKILEAEPIPFNKATSLKKHTPGEIIASEKNGLALVTKEGLLALKKIQVEGKAPMQIEDFLRGNAKFFDTSSQKQT